jgi:hypothetical protein
MANLILNGKTYDIDKLSEEAKGQVVSLQFVDAELAKLNATIAVFQTARNGYLKALLPHLEVLDNEAVKH